MCVSHGVVEVICPIPFVGCVGSASHLRSKSQGRTGGGSWLLDDRPDGVREPRYNDEVILVGVPAAQPFSRSWLGAAGGLVRFLRFPGYLERRAGGISWD